MKRHIRLAAFLFTVVAASAAWAQTATAPLPTAKPEQVGMSSQRLGQISTVLKREIEQGNLPGVVVMVARKGRLVYSEAIGLQDSQGAKPMPKDAIFRIYSMTKPLVSMAAMMLVEEGKIGSPIRSLSSCRP